MFSAAHTSQDRSENSSTSIACSRLHDEPSAPGPGTNNDGGRPIYKTSGRAECDDVLSMSSTPRQKTFTTPEAETELLDRAEEITPYAAICSTAAPLPVLATGPRPTYENVGNRMTMHVTENCSYNNKKLLISSQPQPAILVDPPTSPAQLPSPHQEDTQYVNTIFGMVHNPAYKMTVMQDDVTALTPTQADLQSNADNNSNDEEEYVGPLAMPEACDIATSSPDSLAWPHPDYEDMN